MGGETYEEVNKHDPLSRLLECADRLAGCAGVQDSVFDEALQEFLRAHMAFRGNKGVREQ